MAIIRDETCHIINIFNYTENEFKKFEMLDIVVNLKLTKRDFSVVIVKETMNDLFNNLVVSIKLKIRERETRL